MIEATLRAIFSLTVVLLLMWGLARLVRRPLGGRGAGALAVLSRQPLSRNASVAVVRVDDRALVLGVTDAQVTYLTEAPLSAFERPAPAFADVLAQRTGDDVLSSPEARESGRGPLAGSMLSAATWSQAVGFLRDRPGRQGRGRPR